MPPSSAASSIGARLPPPASSQSGRRSAAPPSASPSPDPGHGPSSHEHDASSEADVPVEVLVEHLLAAKRSLSSITLVLRANDLATQARQLHQESVLLAAQATFMRRAMDDQVNILRQVRRGMLRAYGGGEREFTRIVRSLDAANAKLEQSMDTLRRTVVEPVFRPPGEEARCLIDFVDESSVEAMQEALKTSLKELKTAMSSFRHDVSLLEADEAALQKALTSPSPASSSAHQSIPHLLASLTAHSHSMAEHLASLTRHFDMCVTAIRSTEGGAALARRKAAEVTQSQGGDAVSISGFIPEHESPADELEPMSAEERAEVVQVVVQDAPEVAYVVAELESALDKMEADFAALSDQAAQTRASFTASVAAFHVLEDIGTRLHGYVAAEAEFVQGWDGEKDVIVGKLEEMEGLRQFYEGYKSAYDSLILEAERRRGIEDRIQATWRKARESVDKLLDADRREREVFRQEIGEFLPTDLWVGMGAPLKRWAVVAVEEGKDQDEGKGKDGGDDVGEREGSTPTLNKRLGTREFGAR